jgi:hypothetical protein
VADAGSANAQVNLFLGAALQLDWRYLGLYPLNISAGAGWQGGKWGGWAGWLDSGYEGGQAGLRLSHAFDRVVLIGSAGILAEGESDFPGRSAFGELTQAGLGLRFGLR